MRLHSTQSVPGYILEFLSLLALGCPLSILYALSSRITLPLHPFSLPHIKKPVCPCIFTQLSVFYYYYYYYYYYFINVSTGYLHFSKINYCYKRVSYPPPWPSLLFRTNALVLTVLFLFEVHKNVQ